MESFQVVKEFDGMKQRTQDLCAGFGNTIAKVTEAFGLDRRPKRFGQSVVTFRPGGTRPLRLMLWSICSCSSNKRKPSLACPRVNPRATIRIVYPSRAVAKSHLDGVSNQRLVLAAQATPPVSREPGFGQFEGIEFTGHGRRICVLALEFFAPAVQAPAAHVQLRRNFAGAFADAESGAHLWAKPPLADETLTGNRSL